jgi:hypothetical protein
MLAGDRESLDQPIRSGERIGLAVMALFRPVTPANLRAIAAADVATGLVRAVKARRTLARASCCRGNFSSA